METFLKAKNKCGIIVSVLPWLDTDKKIGLNMVYFLKKETYCRDASPEATSANLQNGPACA